MVSLLDSLIWVLFVKRQAHYGSMKLYAMLCCSEVIESNVCFNIRTLEDDIIFSLNQLPSYQIMNASERSNILLQRVGLG